MTGGVRVWSRRRRPIVAGTVVGVVSGLIGLFATAIAFSTSVGGIVGAVGCGITVVHLSEESLSRVVVHAVIADIASSIVFFGLVLVAYLTAVWLHEGLALISVIWFSMMYVVFGGLLVAVPAAAISLCITGVAATVTSLVESG